MMKAEYANRKAEHRDRQATARLRWSAERAKARRRAEDKRGKK